MRKPEVRYPISQPGATASSGAVEATPTEPRDLALIDRARAALAEVRTLYEAKDLRDKLAALELYAKRHGGLEDSERQAREARLRFERLMGEFTRDLQRSKGGAPTHKANLNSSPEATSKTDALAAVGLKKQEAATYERLAAIPTARFDAEVAKAGATTKALARVGGEYRAKPTRPKRQPGALPAGPHVSDRILDERPRRFQARVERLTTPYVWRWPAGTSVTPLAAALRRVAADIDKVEMERSAGAP